MDTAQLEQQLNQLRQEERQAFGRLVFIQGRVAQIMDMLGRANPDGGRQAPSDREKPSTDSALAKE